jgi:hypothetical protein
VAVPGATAAPGRGAGWRQRGGASSSPTPPAAAAAQKTASPPPLPALVAAVRLLLLAPPPVLSVVHPVGFTPLRAQTNAAGFELLGTAPPWRSGRSEGAGATTASSGGGLGLGQI